MNKKITIYHSPDADDAFMFHGLVSKHLQTPGYEFVSELKDIESLNQLARQGAIDATAVSVHAFSYLNGNYSILNYGASMGESDYGPRLVTKASASSLSSLIQKPRIGLPGELTSATLAFKLYALEHDLTAELVQMHFETLEDAVLKGEIDAGLLIHEGQITHQERGLKTILDLGKWWWEKTELPLPLGVNIVKKSLPIEDKLACAKMLSDSINFSMDNREAAIEYALSFGRGLSYEQADKFIGMYVNKRSVNLGVAGRQSIELFLKCGAEAGFCPDPGKIEFLEA